MTAIPTIDQIRETIDSGETGEKVSHPDPATVPLGADAEAGGNSPTPQERSLEASSRILRRPSAPMNGPLLYAGLVSLVGVAIILIAWLA
jgi:hypothetical protein